MTYAGSQDDAFNPESDEGKEGSEGEMDAENMRPFNIWCP